jgi:hypothetical protein
MTRTDGLSPKAVAAAVAALVAPPLADLLGVDALWLGGLITAVIVAAAAWVAPPGNVVAPVAGEAADDSDDGIDESLELAALAKTTDPAAVRDANAQGELA